METHPSTTREAVEQLNATDPERDGFPIFDPETGEVLAASEQDRFEVIETLARDLVEEVQARVRAVRSRQLLVLLMRPGDAWAGEGGWAVMVRPPASPKRAIIPHALQEHAESLRPLGLAPREVTITRDEFPKVSELTSKAAREELARLGLTPETFLHTPEPGEPSIVVVAPEGS